MKKLFTLLLLAYITIIANAQVTQKVTTVLDNSNLKVDTSGEIKTATYSENGNALFTISTEAGTINYGGSVQDLTYNEQSHPALRIGGASSYGGVFTFTFAENVTDVKMLINCNGNTSVQSWYFNNEVQDGKNNTERIPADGSEPIEVSLKSGDNIKLGNVRFNVIFVVTYTTTIPPTVSDFQVLAQNITTNSAYLNVTYTVENVTDETVYTVYYTPVDATTGDVPENAEYTSVEATSVGTSIILTGLDASTIYYYDVYLDIDGEKYNNLTASFETLTEPTASWSINYAQIAADNLPFNTTINSATTESETCTFRDTSTRFNIGGTGSSYNSNFQFYVKYNGTEIVPKNNVTTNGTLTFRYQNTTTIGLSAGSSTNQYGILNVKEGDVVEVAMRLSSDGSASIENVTNPTNLINLELISSDGQYSFKYISDTSTNVERSILYKVFKYIVTESGNVAFTAPAYAYLAYISVNPETKEEAEVPFAVSSVTEGTGTSLRIINSSAFWILTKIGVTTATLDYTAPDNTTKVEYGFGEVNTIPSGNQKNIVRRAADDNDIEYTEATSNSDGTFQIPFDNITASEQYGTLYIKNTNSDGNVSTVEYDYGKSQGVFTSVEDMSVEADAPVKFFNLQGVQVANPENGIFIKVQGNKVSKVFIK